MNQGQSSVEGSTRDLCISHSFDEKSAVFKTQDFKQAYNLDQEGEMALMNEEIVKFNKEFLEMLNYREMLARHDTNDFRCADVDRVLVEEHQEKVA